MTEPYIHIVIDLKQRDLWEGSNLRGELVVLDEGWRPVDKALVSEHPKEDPIPYIEGGLTALNLLDSWGRSKLSTGSHDDLSMVLEKPKAQMTIGDLYQYILNHRYWAVSNPLYPVPKFLEPLDWALHKRGFMFTEEDMKGRTANSWLCNPQLVRDSSHDFKIVYSSYINSLDNLHPLKR